LGPEVRAFAVSGGTLFAGTGTGVFWTTDNGKTWVDANNGITNSNIRALLVSGATLYAAASTGPFVGGRPPAVYRSTDQGRNWAQVAGNLPISERGEVNALAVSGDSVLVATVDGVFRSDGGQAWTPANNGLTNARTNALVQAGALLFAGTEGSGIF